MLNEMKYYSWLWQLVAAAEFTVAKSAYEKLLL